LSPSTEEIATAVGAAVVETHSVPGGDINRALRAVLEDGREAFVKYRRGAPVEMYLAEADGLSWLAAAGAVRVPAVLGVGRGAQPFLALEWLDMRRSAGGEELGRALAALHGAGADAFGYPRDNFIGPLAQANGVRSTWAEFYGEMRLLPMGRAAAAAGGIAPEALHALDRLIARLDDLVGPPEPPARLHGDLWSGNAATVGGRPCLLDPAVYGGHREVDLAMMRLFGGFDQACFDAYDEVFPSAAGAHERVALYQLYPLLVHAVLFGGGYGARASAAIESYL
jgi:fructosamine-3-kinase